VGVGKKAPPFMGVRILFIREDEQHPWLGKVKKAHPFREGWGWVKIALPFMGVRILFIREDEQHPWLGKKKFPCPPRLSAFH
jgi:hypothetical protein